MTVLRRLARAHPALAGWLVAAALIMKLLVPGGFMLSVEHGRVSVVLCDGFAPSKPDPAMTGLHAMSAHHGDGEERDRTGHEGREVPCAFAGLAFQALAATDPAPLAAAVLFVMAAAFRPIARAAPRDAPRLRPPSRAPPGPPSTT